MPASAITAYKFWQDLGTMGVTAHLTSTSAGPTLSGANDARFMVVSAPGVTTYWAADILGDPAATATTISVRHLLVPGDLEVGTFTLFGQVSLDAGATWYTQLVPIALTVSGP